MREHTATEALAGFVAKTRYEDLPSSTVHAARIAIIDGFANMVAGSREAAANPSQRVFLAQGGTPEASVVGSGRRLPVSNAAFLNSVQLHCLDYEVQGYPPTHGTSSILPAALAIAERDGRSGAELITSFAVGWEVQQRLRTAGKDADLRSFHPPGIFGPLGAAAASANLMGFDAAQTAMVLGYAASHTGGLFGNNGTFTKATHPARAARVGVEAALLIAAGLSASSRILEDHEGFVRAYCGSEFDFDMLCGGLGESYQIEKPGFLIKPYPAEVFMQWLIQAVADLKQETGLRHEEVAAVQVEPALFKAQLLRPHPVSGLDGKFSYEYCAAIALVEQRVTIESFSDAVFSSPEVNSLLGRIEIIHNPEIPSALQSTWSRVTVTTTDGRQLQSTCRKFPGMPERPLTDDARQAKVLDCFRHGGMDEAAAVLALETLERLEAIEDIRDLMEKWFCQGADASNGGK